MVADSLDAEGRTAYLFTYFDNQAAFIDSCRICGGRFVLEGRIPFDEVAAEVLIERVPLFRFDRRPEAATGSTSHSRRWGGWAVRRYRMVRIPRGAVQRPRGSGRNTRKRLQAEF